MSLHTQLLGEAVRVEHIDLKDAEEIVAICRRERPRSRNADVLRRTLTFQLPTSNCLIGA